MNQKDVGQVKKYLQKIRKLFNQISRDCNDYVDEFDTINYSLNKVETILNKPSSITTRGQSKEIEQRKNYKQHIPTLDDSDDSDQECEKVKMIIENCRTTTQTLSRKIKVLCNLPNSNNKTKQYKQFLNKKDDFLKHSQSANVKDFHNKFKSLNHKKKYNNDDDDQMMGRRIIKNLDLDIQKLTKELDREINSKN